MHRLSQLQPRAYILHNQSETRKLLSHCSESTMQSPPPTNRAKSLAPPLDQQTLLTTLYKAHPPAAVGGPNCTITWFHFSCVGLRNEPEGDWFCDQLITLKMMCVYMYCTLVWPARPNFSLQRNFSSGVIWKLGLAGQTNYT